MSVDLKKLVVGSVVTFRCRLTAVICKIDRSPDMNFCVLYFSNAESATGAEYEDGGAYGHAWQDPFDIVRFETRPELLGLCKTCGVKPITNHAHKICDDQNCVPF